jgi:hypothetical protein
MANPLTSATRLAMTHFSCCLSTPVARRRRTTINVIAVMNMAIKVTPVTAAIRATMAGSAGNHPDRVRNRDRIHDERWAQRE